MSLTERLRQLLSAAPAASLDAQWLYVEGDQLQLQHRDEYIPVRMRREPRARAARCKFRGHSFTVSLPPRQYSAPSSVLHEFTPWIREQWNTLIAHAVPLSQVHATQSLLLWGESVPVEWRQARSLSLQLHEGRILAQAPQDGVAPHRFGTALRQFYEAQARTRAHMVLQTFGVDMPRLPSRVVFKNVDSLWGSMSSTGSMTLERSLALAPQYVFDYLVVHELCHLLHMAHDRAFWHEVGLRMPDYQRAEHWLRDQGQLLRLNAARLITPQMYLAAREI